MRRFLLTLFILVLAGTASQFLFKDKFDLLGLFKTHVLGEKKPELVSRPAPVHRVESMAQPRVVKNSMTPRWRDDPAKNRRLTLLWSLGTEKFEFRDAIDIETDVGGNFYVLDYGSKCIDMFNEKAGHVRKIGYGPENQVLMSKPSDLAIDPGGRLVVADSRKGILIFSTAGELVKTVSMPDPVFSVAIGNSAEWITLTPSGAFLLQRRGQSGHPKTLFAKQEQQEFSVMSVIQQASVTVDTEANVYVSFISPYRIFRYSASGKPELEFKRDMETPDTPPTFHRDKDGKIRSVSRQEVSFKIVADDELIYNLVRTKGGSGGDALDVFSKAGEYVQSFYLPEKMRSFTMYKDRIAFITPDRPQRIEVFRIEKI